MSRRFFRGKASHGAVNHHGRVPDHGRDPGEMSRDELLDEIRRLRAADAEKSRQIEKLRMLEAIVDSSEEPIFVKGRDLTYLFVNEAFAKLFGLPVEEILGRASLPTVSSHTTSQAHMHDQEVLMTGTAKIFEEWVEVDGRHHVMQTGKVPWRRADGEIAGIVGISRDISAQKAAEDSLRESEGRFRDFVEVASDWYWEMDESLRFTYFSARIYEISGMNSEDLLGNTRAEFSAERTDDPAWLEHFAILDKRLPFREFEYRVQRPDGSSYDLSVSGKPIFDEAGCFKGYRGTGTDVTLRKAAEEALQKSKQELKSHRDHLQEMVDERTAELKAAKEKAEQASRVKSDFLSMISHEVRTPLAGILGMTDTILRRAGDEEQKRQLETIRKSGHTLQKILDDVLDFSRGEAGALVFDARAFDLGELAGEVAELYRPSAREKGIFLDMKTGTRQLAPLVGDPDRLKQVLMNLVGNAVKFTDKGGVQIHVAEKGVSKDGGIRVRCEVRDSGIGIAEEAQKLLFQPFSQADVSVSRLYGGTGLGLAISRRLCELMGGRIGVESRKGKGATFWFELTLPAAEGRENAGSRSAPVEDPRGGLVPLNILVAEDHEVNQEMMRIMLEDFGHRVTVAENGRLAVDAVKGGGFDLVLMDMQMPVMDGLEATRAIRALPGEAAHIPVLAITADAISEHRHLFLGAGVNELLGKPIDWDELGKALSRYSPSAKSGR